MKELNFEQMQEMQRELQDKYKDKWPTLEPKVGRDKLLWMLIEAGEIADIVKKQGDDRIMSDEAVRSHFVEEVCDTIMYLNDVLLCYQITPQELQAKYIEKHNKNMGRW